MPQAAWFVIEGREVKDVSLGDVIKVDRGPAWGEGRLRVTQVVQVLRTVVMQRLFTQATVSVPASFGRGLKAQPV